MNQFRRAPSLVMEPACGSASHSSRPVLKTGQKGWAIPGNLNFCLKIHYSLFNNIPFYAQGKYKYKTLINSDVCVITIKITLQKPYCKYFFHYQRTFVLIRVRTKEKNANIRLINLKQRKSHILLLQNILIRQWSNLFPYSPNIVTYFYKC